MEWIKPDQLTPPAHADTATDADQILSFVMLRALVSARQAASAARCGVPNQTDGPRDDESDRPSGRIDNPQSFLRIFGSGGTNPPPAARETGQTDA